MSWYYTRETGADGQIVTDEGEPQGVSLTEFLRDGPLPMKVGIELVAFMADILTIAQEDDAVHGDLKPGCVFVGSGGEVSILGYGISRRGGRAPEGRSVGVQTDTYGLGMVLHAVLSSESMGSIPRDRDGHDDAIVDKLVSIDWSEMGDKKWLDPVMHFLCSMLAYDPGERPEPLDVANILGEVAVQLPGKSVESWARRAVPAQGGGRPPKRIESGDDEDLSGPQSIGKAMNNTGGFGRRQAASAKGQCTAFWTREKIAAMLDEDAEPAVEPLGRGGRRLPPPPMVPPAQPEAGRAPPPKLGLSEYPSGVPISPDATISGQEDDPEIQEVLRAIRSKKSMDEMPRASVPTSSAAHGVRPPDVESEGASWVGRTRTGDGLRPSPGLEDLPPADVDDPPEYPPPPGHGIAQATPAPVISAGHADPGRVSTPDSRAPKAVPWLAIGIGVGTVVLALGVFVVALVIYLVKHPELMATGSEAIDNPVQTAVDDMVAQASADTGDAAKQAKQAKRKAKRKAKRAKRARSTSRPVPSKARRSSSRSTPPRQAPPPATPAPPVDASGAFVVRFRSMGAEARIECGDGQSVTFIGTTRRQFRSITTCRVRIGDAIGAVQVRRDSSVTCSPNGATVQCRGS